MTPSRRPMLPIVLTRRHRHVVYAVGLLLVATGLAWVVCHFLLRGDGEMADLPHPWEPFWMKVHGAVAMIALLVIGSLVQWHAWRAWQIGRNRLTGSLMAVAIVVLIVSGWALYYLSSETARPVISLVHWIVGFAGIPALVWHVVSGRRRAAAPRPVEAFD